MQMFSFKSRAALMCLLLVYVSSGCLGNKIPQYYCAFDEINKNTTADLPLVTLVEDLPQSKENARSSTFTAVSDTWAPIRIRTSSADLEDDSKYCKQRDQQWKSVKGEDKICTEKDIVTAEKKQLMRRVVRSAIKMHSERLKVQPINGGFKVPVFKSEFCNRFTVPEKHRTTGVQDTDMLLYLSFSLKGWEDHFAAGAPCAQISTGRPVVGAITYTVDALKETPYTVRVAAHEIAHALGFSYKLMEKNKGVKPTKKKDVRKKPHVMEVRGVKTLEKTKAHFGCEAATGMELEDENGTISVPSHSHWEQRNAKDELMAGIVGRGYYTALTLAFFEDTGYYKAVFDKAESMEWGANAGCKFLTEFCIKDGVSQFPNMFCTDEEYAFICASDGRTIGECFLMKDNQTLPLYYQYFTDKKDSGWDKLLTDRCPIVEEQVRDGCNVVNGRASGKKGTLSTCLRTKKGSTVKISREDHYGICAIVSLDESTKSVKLDYGQDGAPEGCTNNTITAKSPFQNAQFVCPTYEEAFATAEHEKNDMNLLTVLKANENDESDAVVLFGTKPTEKPEDTVDGSGKKDTNPLDTPKTPEGTAATNDTQTSRTDNDWSKDPLSEAMRELGKRDSTRGTVHCTAPLVLGAMLSLLMAAD